MRDRVQRREQNDKPPAVRPRMAQTADVESAATSIGPTARSLDARMVLALQRTVGNAAVVQLLRNAGLIQRSAAADVLGSTGRPLDSGTRNEMESRLGADFGDVRVHDGAAAAESAKQLGARAYTSGSHIVLGEDGSDKHTLAHELTHVIQQRRGPVAGTDNGAGLRLSDPSDRFEREAEANAARALSGPAPSSRSGADAGAVRAGTSRPESGAGPVVQLSLMFDTWSKDNGLTNADGQLTTGSLDNFFKKLDENNDEKHGEKKDEKQEERDSTSGGVKEQLKAMFDEISRSDKAIGVEVGDLNAQGTFTYDVNSQSAGTVKVRAPRVDAHGKISPVELGYFIGSLAHELQHAVDFVKGQTKIPAVARKPDTARKTMESHHTIASELRAWGREAFTAMQLDTGDANRKDLIKFYKRVRGTGTEISGLANAVLATPANDPFTTRLTTYLRMEGFPTESVEKPLAWLAKLILSTPAEKTVEEKCRDVVLKGLIDGAEFFGESTSSPSTSSSSSSA